MKIAAFDVETSGEQEEFSLQPWRVRQGKAWLTSLAWVWRKGGATQYSGGLLVSPSETTKMIRRMLAWAIANESTLVGWNVLFDIAWLYAYAEKDDGIVELLDKVRFLDAMLLWRHLDIEPEYDHKLQRSYSLKAAVPIFFPKHAGYEADIDYHGADPAELARLHEYNIKDCVFTLRLARKFWEGLSHSQQTIAITEAASFKMIARANLDGLIVDTLEAGNLSANLKRQASACLVSLAPHGITEKIVRSPKQLGEVLYDQWELPVLEFTATGTRSTSKAVLHKLALRDKRVRQIRTYREALNNDTKFATAPLKSCAYNGDRRSHPQMRVFGTYCVPGNVEVLTCQGWQRIETWSGGDIMQVRPDRSMAFLPASRHDDGVVDQWVEVRKLRCQFTRNHLMPYLKQRTLVWTTQQAEEWLGGGEAKNAPVAGFAELTGQYTIAQMRLFVAVQADGYSTDRYLKFTFKKQRKIIRLCAMLDALDIRYRRYVCAAYPDRTEIVIAKSFRPLWLGHDKKHFGPWVLDTTQAGLAAFVDELVHWDGSRHQDGDAVNYNSIISANHDWVGIACALTGLKSQRNGERTHISSQGAYRTILPRDNRIVNVTAEAFCPVTETGFWLARSNGRIFITGNTGRMTYSSKQGKGKGIRQTGFALHQMKRDPLFRQIIVPPPGFTLMEFDAAGQEYRWMAIASNDPTMLQLCQPGEDPHAYMGSRINRTLAYRQIQKGAKVAGSPEANARQCGKCINLSNQYRVGYKKLQQIAEVDYNIPLSLEEAQRIQRIYLQTYPGIQNYWNHQIRSAQSIGYVETIPGRRVRITGQWGGEMSWQMEGTAINYRIQGTGAEQKYLALRCVREYLNEIGARFAWDLHDGLYFYVPAPKVRDAAHRIKDILDTLPYEATWGFKPPIPLPWSCRIGPSWGDLTPFTFE